MRRAARWMDRLRPMSLPPDRRGASHALTLGLLTMAVVYSCLTNDFLFDDYALIVLNPLLRDPSRLGELLEWGRPLRALTLLADFHLWGEYAPGFRLTNLLLYFLCADRIRRLAGRLSGSTDLGFLTAVFWLVMPIHVESYVVISNRKELLALLFQLLALQGWMDRDRRRWALPAAFVAFLLAALSKQVALVLPVFLLFHAAWERRSGAPIRWGRVTAALALFFLLPLAGLGIGYEDFELFGHFGRGDLFGPLHRRYLLTAPWILLRYLRLSVFGWGLQVDYMPDPVTSALSIRFWGPLAVLAAAGAAAAAASRRRPLIGWAAAWTLIHAIPVLNAIPQNYLMADRYFLTPSLGVAFLMALAAREAWRRAPEGGIAARAGTAALYVAQAVFLFYFLVLFNQTIYAALRRAVDPDLPPMVQIWGFDPVKTFVNLAMGPLVFPLHSLLNHPIAAGRRQAAMAALAAVLTAQMALTLARQAEWQPPPQIWLVETIRNPRSVTAHHNLAWYYERQGRYAEASAHYQRAIQLAPDLNPKAYFALGNLLLNQARRPEMALPYLLKAIELDRAHPERELEVPEAFNSLSVAYVQLRQPQQAEAALHLLLESYPRDAQGHNNLAVLLRDRGRPDEAERLFRRAADLQPDFVKARFNRAILLLIDLDRPEEARPLLEEAVARDPRLAGPARPYRELLAARRAEAAGDVEGALARLERIAGEWDAMADVHAFRAAALQRHGRAAEAVDEWRRAAQLNPRFEARRAAPAQP